MFLHFPTKGMTLQPVNKVSMQFLCSYIVTKEYSRNITDRKDCKI